MRSCLRNACLPPPGTRQAPARHPPGTGKEQANEVKQTEDSAGAEAADDEALEIRRWEGEIDAEAFSLGGTGRCGHGTRFSGKTMRGHDGCSLGFAERKRCGGETMNGFGKTMRGRGKCCHGFPKTMRGRGECCRGFLKTMRGRGKCCHGFDETKRGHGETMNEFGGGTMRFLEVLRGNAVETRGGGAEARGFHIKK